MSSMFDISLLSDEEAMKVLETAAAVGEFESQFGLENADIGSPEENTQGLTAQSLSGDVSDFRKAFGYPVEFGDFAAFTATGQDLSTQKRVSFSDLLANNGDYPNASTEYPALDELTGSIQPYFCDPTAQQVGYFGVIRDNEVIQTPATDGTFPVQLDNFTGFPHGQDWREFMIGPPLSQYEIDQACRVATPFSSDIWNARPALDELASPDVAHFRLQPPPLPLHSKPNLTSHARLQQAHFRSQGGEVWHAHGPTATIVPRTISESHAEDSGSEWSPTNTPVDEDPEDLALTPPRQRKALAAPLNNFKRHQREVPVIRLDDSDDGAPSISHLDKEQRMKDCATKMVYAQGSVQQIQPGSRLNPRTKIILQANQFKEIYDQLPTLPTKNWGPFRYSTSGEVNVGDLLTVSDIHNYLYRHPLNTLPSGAHDMKNGGLRLWIQRNPSDSARRYPSPCASRCRFRECFATNNVINQGHLRVCFDEQSQLAASLRLYTDPFYDAAFYVHLNCLERFLDFPAICRDLNISPENRNLPLEAKSRNRMLLSPDSNTHIVYKFIRDCENGTLKDHPAHGRPHEGTLVHKLMANKVEEEANVFRRQQAMRGEKASHVTVHLGDLELEAKVRDKTRKVKYQVDRKTEEPAGKKRKARDESDVESDSEEEVKPKRKYIKRIRA